MPAHGGHLQDFRSGQLLRLTPNAPGKIGRMGLNARFPKGFGQGAKRSADHDRQPQIGLFEALHELGHRFEIRKNAMDNTGAGHVGNDLFRTTGENGSGFHVAEIDGLVLDGHPEKFPHFLFGALFIDALCRHAQKNIVPIQAFRGSSTMQRMGHFASSLNNGRPRPILILPLIYSGTFRSSKILSQGAVPSSSSLLEKVRLKTESIFGAAFLSS